MRRARSSNRYTCMYTAFSLQKKQYYLPKSQNPFRLARLASLSGRIDALPSVLSSSFVCNSRSTEVRFALGEKDTES